MAANARAFGYCFNPISVFWCWDAARRAGRHRRRGAQHLRRPPRLPRPSRRAGPGHGRRRRCTSRRSTAPTAPTSWPCRCPGDRLDIAVTLHTDDGARFSASLTGPPDRRPGRSRRSRGPARRPADPAPRHLAVAAPAPGPTPTRTTTRKACAMTTTANRVSANYWPGLDELPDRPAGRHRRAGRPPALPGRGQPPRRTRRDRRRRPWAAAARSPSSTGPRSSSPGSGATS